MSSEDLLQENASWHLKCCKSATNKGHIERLKTSYDKALLTGHVPNPSTRGRPSASGKSFSLLQASNNEVESPGCRFHRSSSMQFDNKRCFFCQSSETKGLHQINSFNAGKQLEEAVEASNNQQWQVQLSATLNPYDVHACDFKYHLPCWV